MYCHQNVSMINETSHTHRYTWTGRQESRIRTQTVSFSIKQNQVFVLSPSTQSVISRSGLKLVQRRQCFD